MFFIAKTVSNALSRHPNCTSAIQRLHAAAEEVEDNMCTLRTRPLVRDWMVAGVDAYPVGGSRGTRQPKQVEGRQEVQTLCTPGSAVDASPSGAVEGTPCSALTPSPSGPASSFTGPAAASLSASYGRHGPHCRCAPPCPCSPCNGVPCMTQEDDDNARSAVLPYLSVYPRGFLHARKRSLRRACTQRQCLMRDLNARALHEQADGVAGGVGGMGMWERVGRGAGAPFLSEGSTHAAVFDGRLERTCVGTSGQTGRRPSWASTWARGSMWAEMRGRGCMGACGRGCVGVGGVCKPVKAQAWEEELAWRMLSVRRMPRPRTYMRRPSWACDLSVRALHERADWEVARLEEASGVQVSMGVGTWEQVATG
ncbi:hypothetical protein B0H10DRAFT_1961286 [Mycena sp. CBHHK59/15]|nr:hypothetical protein B0H10DRAFT_1961286 [Mycena sp. CBHHK59/15]